MKKIKVPILNNEYCVYVLLGNANETVKWVNSYYPDTHYQPNEMDEYRGNVFYQKGYYPTIILDDKNLKKRKHFWATLAHEAIHAVNHIWDDIEEKHGEGEELFAHSVSAIMSAVEKE